MTDQIPENAAKWLREYSGSFEFYLSLKKQFEQRGTLSQKQIESVLRAVERDSKPQSPQNMTYKPGDLITIRKWLANSLGAEKGLKIFFRNLRVVEQHKETARAVQVTVQFETKIATCCHVCGLPLDNEISLATGIGPVCAERFGFKRPKISEAKDIVEAIEKESQIAGNIGPIWIPKSQIIEANAQIAS